jgi:Na+-transporting NADH:ubiquinone oxidoreductase subunit NqrA
MDARTERVVTFDRIGRNRSVPPITTVLLGDDLAGRIENYARRFLGSREVEVTVLGTPEGEPTDGFIVVGGFRAGGSFTIEKANRG